MTLLFWGCAAYVVYAYVGFPLLTILRGRFRPRPYRRAEIEPSVRDFEAVVPEPVGAAA